MKLSLPFVFEGKKKSRRPAKPKSRWQPVLEVLEDRVTPSLMFSQLVDLSLVKTVNCSTPAVGETITFSVSVTDKGPGNATGVTVKDLLPAGLTFVSATGPGSYNAQTGVWSVGALNNGATDTLQIKAEVDTWCPVTNTAQVTGSNQINCDCAPVSVTITPHCPPPPPPCTPPPPVCPPPPCTPPVDHCPPPCPPPPVCPPPPCTPPPCTPPVDHCPPPCPPPTPCPPPPCTPPPCTPPVDHCPPPCPPPTPCPPPPCTPPVVHCPPPTSCPPPVHHCPPKTCPPCKPKDDDHCHVRKDHDHKDKHCHVRKDHDHKDHSKGVCHLKTHDIDKCFAHKPHFSAFCA